MVDTKTFTPADADFAERVRANFARQKFMETIGAKLSKVLPGEVQIELPYNSDLTQQHGYLHAGVVTAIVDSACGYAAMSLTPAGTEVLSVEFKINLLSPAIGETMLAIARVVRAGRNLSVCMGDVYAVSEGKQKIVATMLATMMTLAR